MLPLVIASSKYQGILHPDAASSQMEPSIDEGFSEVESFCIGMEDIGGSTFCKVVSHVLECLKQELIELITLERIILNGQTIGALEGSLVFYSEKKISSVTADGCKAELASRGDNIYEVQLSSRAGEKQSVKLSYE